MDPQQALVCLNFGRVDGESDDRFSTCFIGTEMLRGILKAQHTLLVGNKGSGKSAICRLLIKDLAKVKPLLPRNYAEIYCIPAYGLQTEENVPGVSLKELNPSSVDEFRDFWLLYLGMKGALRLVNDDRMRGFVERTQKSNLKKSFETLERVLVTLGLRKDERMFFKMKNVLSGMFGSSGLGGNGQAAAGNTRFKDRTGVSIIGLLEHVDLVLRETNSLAWMLLDGLDLLFVDDFPKLKASITGLVRLLVQYGNHFRNIHLKIFLRNDIFRQLHIANKSQLASYSSEMKWRESLLLKVLVVRAVDDQHVKSYCQEVLGDTVDVSAVILGSDEYVLKVFYAIFEPTLGQGKPGQAKPMPTHQWILRGLRDGTGSSFPRELIHLGNKAVEQQREMNRIGGNHLSTHLIGPEALREAFAMVSSYRCDTYLYSEFPHLSRHFDVFRGSDTTTFHREVLYMLFAPLSPNGDEAIRALYDTGLLQPLGRNVDSSMKFKVPLLYRPGLGVRERRPKPVREDRPPVRREGLYVPRPVPVLEQLPDGDDEEL
ncbi:MAG TPA: hypothetical protein VI932_00755 [Bacteroidota bacterium]|nr:hypothetical protein [Bacteroidota bacterium]